MRVFETVGLKLAVCVLGALPLAAVAQGVPVQDTPMITQSAANSAREVAEMVRQYEQLLEQYNMLEQQRALLEKQFNAISGLSDISDLSSRKFERLGSSLDMLGYTFEGASDAADLPGGAAAAMERRSISLGLGDGLLGEFGNSDIAARRILSERGSAGLVASALGENGYDQSNDLAADAEELRSELGQQETLKEAVDFNSAVLMKLLQVQIETLRTSSANALVAGADTAAAAAEHSTVINYARGDGN